MGFVSRPTLARAVRQGVMVGETEAPLIKEAAF